MYISIFKDKNVIRKSFVKRLRYVTFCILSTKILAFCLLYLLTKNVSGICGFGKLDSDIAM